MNGIQKAIGGICMLLGSVAAAATPEQVCEASKTKAIGRMAACLTSERAKEVKARPPDYAKCGERLLTAFAKAEAKALDHGGSCPTTGDAAAIEARLDEQLDPTTGIASAVSANRFIDYGDDTIRDTQTCLVWEKKDALDGVIDQNNPHDADNKYTWGTVSAANGTIFSDFLRRLNACTSNDGGSTITGGFAGYCDWRLPGVDELRTIQGTLPGCSSLDLCIDPIFAATQTERYVSSTTILPFEDHLWDVNFQGPTGAGSAERHVPAYVRAVRGARCD